MLHTLMGRPKSAVPTKLLTAQVDPVLLEKAVRIARLADTSVSREVRKWLAGFVDAYEAKHGPLPAGE